jgi:TolB-like protein/DNA-binding winged helix-turn-helix (wHTH) protein
MTEAPEGRIRFAEFEVDVEARVLCRAGAPIKLQQQPFDVLMAVLERPGRLVSRDELRQRIWQSNTFVDFDHSLNIAVNKLRAALNDSPEQHRFIETIPRRGYRFVGPVESPGREAPTALGVNPDRDQRPGRRLRATASVVGVAALSIVVSVGFVATSRTRRAGIASTSTTAGHRIASIAVLPLVDLSPDASKNSYFADSMTDELITNLAQLRGVSIVARTSILSFKAPHQPLPDIAGALRVDAIVEGTIVRVGDRVRITAQLIDAVADRHLWARSYERDLRDILALQRDVTSEIASAIGREVETPSRRVAVNAAAYDEYLRGRFAWNVRSDAALHEGIEHFIRATELDPTYAPAYAGLADCYTTLGYLSNILPSDGFQAARAAAERALQLDESLAEAHASLAYTHLYYDWDWTGAEREFRRAISLNPDYATGHQWYGVFLTAMMRPGEARTEIEHARTLDPLSAAIATDIGFQLYYTRQYDSAVQHLSAVIDLNPKFPLAHLWLGRTYQQKHMLTEAVAEFGAVEEALPDWPVTVAAIGSADAWAGHRHDAHQILDRLHGLSNRRYVTPYAYAVVYAALGESDEAIGWLQRGVAERTPWMIWLKLDPRWGVLADDPRFAQVVKRVGLP